MQTAMFVFAVKAPAFGAERRTEMEDIAMLTRQRLSAIAWVLNQGCKGHSFGSAKKVVVKKDMTTIVEGGGKKPRKKICSMS